MTICHITHMDIRMEVENATDKFALYNKVFKVQNSSQITSLLASSIENHERLQKFITVTILNHIFEMHALARIQSEMHAQEQTIKEIL